LQFSFTGGWLFQNVVAIAYFGKVALITFIELRVTTA
jgi:hypothetical protein